MNRRAFFGSAFSVRERKKYVRYYDNVQSGLQPYTGAWTFDEAAHLLRRTMFGAKKQDIDHALSLSVQGAIDALLAPVAVPSPPLREYGMIEMDNGMYDDPNVQQGQTWVNDLQKIEDGDLRATVFNNRSMSLRKWWVGVMANQSFSIMEKMVLFWHHHYSIQKEEVEHPIMLYRHLALLRGEALGNIKQLTKAVTIDPAMLIHLNGYLNSKVAPDENYARELQELFTVGKGENSLYTEEDVMEAARVLTGWRVDRDSLEVKIEAESHDTGSKTFSSFYNNTSISGSDDAMLELDALVNMIFSNREASLFICRKIYRWFVNSTIDASTESNVIGPLADILIGNNFEIKPVVETLLKSEHFFDPANRACYIKSPYDFIIGAMREFEVSIPDYTNHTNGYPLFQSLYTTAARMGMDLLQPPDVNGWPAYHQDPMFYEMWVNSNSLPIRADFTDALIGEGVVDVKAFAALFTDPSDADLFINEITQFLLKYPLSDSSKAYIKNNFLLEQSADTDRWRNIWNSNNASVILPPLRRMIQFITNLPEYHLC